MKRTIPYGTGGEASGSVTTGIPSWDNGANAVGAIAESTSTA